MTLVVSVGEERTDYSAVDYLLFCALLEGVYFCSWCQGYGMLFDRNTSCAVLFCIMKTGKTLKIHITGQFFRL